MTKYLHGLMKIIVAVNSMVALTESNCSIVLHCV